MIFLEKKMVRSSFFILFVQLISSYLIFSASPRNTEIRIQSSYTNSLSDDGLKSENDQIKQLNNKLHNEAKQNNKAKQSMLRRNVRSEAKRSAKQHIGLDVIKGKPPKAAFECIPQHMLVI